MKTYVLWTHYDCEVYVSLHATEWEAWLLLRNGWLDDCDDDCGHEPDSYTTADEIRDAIEWHYEELSYDIQFLDVPVTSPTAEQSASNDSNSTISAPVPDRNTMPAERADSLLASLQSFQEGS